MDWKRMSVLCEGRVCGKMCGYVVRCVGKEESIVGILYVWGEGYMHREGKKGCGKRKYFGVKFLCMIMA